MNADTPDREKIVASGVTPDVVHHPQNTSATRIPTTTDKLLIEGLRAGSNQAYVKLVETHIGVMLKIARRYVGEEDAKDAVQEAFIKAFNSIDQFKANSRIGTWLQRIVINCCLMQLRKSKSTMEVSIDTLLPTFYENGHRANTSPAWPDEYVERVDAISLVSTSIKHLPESYRTVLMMRDIDGYSGAETARLLGIAVNLVKVRLHRARQALREMIETERRS